jgi:uncharacterized protein YecE (DUF72 family)
LDGGVFIGTAGWSYEDWKGTVYPSPEPRGFKPLKYLSGFFDCVEVNSTFYRPCSRSMAEGWLRQTEDRPGFTFTLKLWQRFTHERNEIWPAADVKTFCDGIEPLQNAGRLGALLMQFPQSFHDDGDNREWLAGLADAFGKYPLVVEVRHISWDTDDARDFLARSGLNFCNVDQPKFKGTIGTTAQVTGKVAYVRLHGRNLANWFRKDAGRDARYDYYYSAEELAGWIERIKALAEKAPKAYVIANNHYRGQAAANALQLRAALRGEKVAVPEALAQSYRDLAAISAEPPEQRTLF